MIVARPLSDGSFEELSPALDVTVGEGASAVTIPWTNFTLWTNADAQPFGLYIVPTPAPPPGKTRVSYSLAWNADRTAVEYRPVYEDQPEPVVTSITPRQMELALLEKGLLASVNSIVSGLSPAEQISWNRASYYDRNDPMLVRLSAAQKWTPEQLDEIFTLGATL